MKSLADLLVSILPQRQHDLAATESRVCAGCQTDLSQGNWPLFQRYRVCDSCGHHFTIPARERIQQMVDSASFHEFSQSLTSADPLAFADRLPYRERLEAAQRKTGATEAVVTGTCKIGGSEAVLAVLDFDFLGGSMGSVVGEKVTLAFELAIRRKLPIVTVATSGGARMQEGMLSLVQMAKTAAAARQLHEAHLPFVSILANPTTGGIYASFASLGDVVIAEPRALIGFAGPRVVQQTMHQTGPDVSHRAEYLLARGAIDQIIDRPRLRERLVDLLAIWASAGRQKRASPPAQAAAAPPEGQAAAEPEEPASEQRPGRSAWETVQIARRKDRPTAADYIHGITTGFFELHGDRYVGDDPAVVAGLAQWEGQPVAIVGQ
ncbi:MAG: acetyl-CoA carboxylase carboxyltransferase subunit alpha/beta, partial [Chloroflexota bacterium]